MAGSGRSLRRAPTAVMRRKCTLQSRTNGPNLAFALAPHAAAQLHQSGHWNRFAAFCYVRGLLSGPGRNRSRGIGACGRRFAQIEAR
jgi:hypothetical protein